MEKGGGIVSFGLVVRFLTLEEVKELLRLVREITAREGGKLIVCAITGLEGLPVEEAKKIMTEIFPRKGVAA